jgi:peptidoglycan/xylan/chitin deacetylase (PgdA/CDA1 family)
LKLKIFISGLSLPELTFLRSLLHPFETEISSNSEDCDLVITKGSEPDAPLVVLGSQSQSSGQTILKLPPDLLRRSLQIFQSVMKPQISLSYRIATGLPFQYNIVPAPVRARLLRSRRTETDLSAHVFIQGVRKTIVDAISEAGFPYDKPSPKLIVTHDIDTRKGLERALAFKEVEDRLGMKSICFLPSSEYEIDRQIAKDLGDGLTTIGSHDVKHDGKLIRISNRRELAGRLAQSKLELGRIFDREIDSFRSPLLQFNEAILIALNEAGYRHDYSLPCWEPVNPSVMGSFGIECANSLAFGSLIETPLTLFQDHQMFYVQKFSVSEATKVWLEQARFLISIGGDVVLLTHPEYNFAQDLPAYGRLLEELCKVVQPQAPSSESLEVTR